MKSGLGLESVPPNESLTIEKIAAITTGVSTKVHKRAVHLKPHGCVRARFRVNQDLRQDLIVGVFKPGAEYDAQIRFSNGNPAEALPDSVPDLRGMAIKIAVKDNAGAGVEQDFILSNTKVFFSSDAADQLEFLEPFSTKDRIRIKQYFDSHPRQSVIFNEGKITITNPLGPQQYYSSVPYKLGSDRAVKYSAKLTSPAISLPEDKSPNFLRNTLSAQLRQGEAHFDFFVQVQTDPVKMPVEDATVEWSEELSPFVRVATITVEKQDVGNCENLAFDPWHALPEHAPLGGINRARKVIYQRSVAARGEQV